MNNKVLAQDNEPLAAKPADKPRSGAIRDPWVLSASLRNGVGPALAFARPG